jgi:hypothetical protein
MDLLALVIVLIVIGAALSIAPIEPQIKRGIVIVVLVVIALILLRAYLPPIPIGR